MINFNSFRDEMEKIALGWPLDFRGESAAHAREFRQKADVVHKGQLLGEFRDEHQKRLKAYVQDRGKGVTKEDALQKHTFKEW